MGPLGEHEPGAVRGPGGATGKEVGHSLCVQELSILGDNESALNKQAMISESEIGGKFSFSKDTEVSQNETLYIKTKSHTER